LKANWFMSNFFAKFDHKTRWRIQQRMKLPKFLGGYALYQPINHVLIVAPKIQRGLLQLMEFLYA